MHYCCFTNSFEHKQQENAIALFPISFNSFVLQSSPRIKSVRRDRTILFTCNCQNWPPPFTSPGYVPERSSVLSYGQSSLVARRSYIRHCFLQWHCHVVDWDGCVHPSFPRDRFSNSRKSVEKGWGGGVEVF